MNKTEMKKEINRRFYVYVETNFPQYELDFNEGGGRVYLTLQEGINIDVIEYHQSNHEVICSNNASKQTREDVARMQFYLDNNIIPFMKLITKN